MRQNGRLVFLVQELPSGAALSRAHRCIDPDLRESWKQLHSMILGYYLTHRVEETQPWLIHKTTHCAPWGSSISSCSALIQRQEKEDMKEKVGGNGNSVAACVVIVARIPQ